MATHLKRLRLNRIDFVDRGANPDAHIALFKRHTPEEQSMADKQLTPEEQIADLTAKLAKANADLEEATRPTQTPEDIEKTLPEPVKALLAKARKDADDAAAVAKANADAIAKLEADRDRTVMIQKASEFKALGAAEDLTSILLPISKSAPKEAYEALLTKMKGWQEIARTSKLFAETGSNADGAVEPEAQLNVLAKAHHKAHPELTEQQAYAHVLTTTEGTALYKASQLAKRGGR